MKKTKNTVKLLRTGNVLTVVPPEERSGSKYIEDVRALLGPALTFPVKVWLRGRDKAIARKRGQPTVLTEYLEAFVDDIKGRLTTCYGFYSRIRRTLLKSGFEVRVENLTPHSDPSVFEPKWDRVYTDDVTLRHRQEEFLVKVATYENGVFDCPTGYGKSWLAGLTALMLPKARIAIVSDSVTVVRDRIYPELAQMLPDVGIVGGGRRIRDRRVMCYTVDSMHWLIADAKEFGDFDIVLFDECFPAGTLVDGRPIETIKVGESVWSVNHVDGRLERRRVTRLFRSAPKQLCRVIFDDGSSLVSTASHPYYAPERSAYVRAAELITGEAVVFRSEANDVENQICVADLAVYGVRGVDFGGQQKSTRQKEGLLFEHLRASLQESSVLDDCYSYQQKTRCEANASQKSYEKRTHAAASFGGAACSWLEAGSAGRQRAWTDETRGVIGGGVELGVSCYCADVDAERVGLSDSLQGRRRACGVENSDRDRWSEPQLDCSTGTGSEKTGVLGIKRVSRVEVYEPGGGGEPGSVRRDGYVYNFEVEGNHNYFAEGILVHNCHQAAADNASYMLATIPGQPRMFGFTATHNMRGDGKDFRVEGHFGPSRMRITYEEAKNKGMIVPMEVRVRKVVMDVNPAADYVDEEKMRRGVWQNSYRNRLILNDAMAHAAAGEQTMISCYYLEHVLHIKKEFDKLKAAGKVPDNVELVCIYREHADKHDWNVTKRKMSREHKNVGDVFASLPYMSLDRRLRLTKRIEQGKIKLFVATTIFNVGFDPKDMWVVCRADCGSTKIADTQIPGRNSRHTRGHKKQVAVLHDYWDKFDAGLEQRFKNRLRSYKELQWEVKVRGKKHTALGDLMGWE